MSETLWDAPNQQVVRPDESAPWDEGEGGSSSENTSDPKTRSDGDTPSLDEMTKAELLEHARELGVSPANNDMTKEELRAAIDDKLAGSD